MGRSSRGIMLPAALAMLVVLLVFLVALNHQKNSARAVLTASEVAFQADISARNAQAVLGQGLMSDPIPGAATVLTASESFDFEAGLDPLTSADQWTVHAETEVYHRAPVGAAETLFKKDMSEVGSYKKAAKDAKVQGKSQSFFPWMSRSQSRFDSSDPALRSMNNRVLDSAYHAGFGYAALAPKGSVELASAVAWVNPTHEQAKKMLSAGKGKFAQDLVSGLPVKVAAQKDVTVTNFPYGEAYSEKGSISVDKGGAIGFEGFFPIPKGTSNSYDQLLKNQLDSAYSRLKSNSVDKTDLIFGDLGIATIVKLFTGGFKKFPDNLLTLEMALKFPMPMLFQIGKKGKGLIWLYIHPAFPPDQNLANIVKELEKTDTATETMKKLNAARVKLGRLERQKKSLIAKRNAASGDKRKKIQKDLNKKKNEIKDTKDEIKKLEKKLTTLSKDSKDTFDDSIANQKIKAFRSATETVAKENEAIKSLGLTRKKGWTGWAYVMVIINQWAKIAQLVVDVADAIISGDTFDVDSLMGVFSTQTRVIHLNKKAPSPSPKLMFKQDQWGTKDGQWAYQGTLSVPRGRTFRIRTKLALEGDLWIGRGATMVVDDDLTLTADSNASTDPFKRSGRIYLEEGASLVVGGSLEAAGDPAFGSVVVGSPVSKEHPITSAIIVKKNVDLPYGTRPGVALDDLAAYLEVKFNLKNLETVTRTVIQDIVPNAAKIKGPFSTRVCYFAKYATSIAFPKPFPVPLPIPRPDKKNKLIPLFRVMSMVYTVHLNLTIGDNLQTQSPWWVFGEDRVPILPKIDPDGLKSHVETGVKALKKFVGNEKEMKKALTDLGEDVAKKIVSEVFKALIIEMVEQAVLEFLNGISPVAGYVYTASGASDAVGEKIETFVDDNYDKVVGPLMKKIGLDGDYNGSLDSLMTAAEAQLKNRSADVLLRETPGLLVYAGDALTIGGSGGSALLATGFFIAGNDLESTADFTVGCLVSLEGDITAGKVLYNPYFTRASLYLPKKLKIGGTGIASNDDHWDNAINFLYGKALDDTHKGTKSLEIGPNTYRVTAEGWRRQ